MSTAASLFDPDSHLVVGPEDDTEDGSLRVYVDSRYTGIHSHVADEGVKDQFRQAWAMASMPLCTTIPAEALCNCPSTVTPNQPEMISTSGERHHA